MSQEELICFLENPMNDILKVGNILVIDDDELDHYLCQRVVERSPCVDNALYFDLAEDALAYLRRSDRGNQCGGNHAHYFSQPKR